MRNKRHAKQPVKPPIKKTPVPPPKIKKMPVPCEAFDATRYVTGYCDGCDSFVNLWRDRSDATAYLCGLCGWTVSLDYEKNVDDNTLGHIHHLGPLEPRTLSQILFEGSLIGKPFHVLGHPWLLVDKHERVVQAQRVQHHNCVCAWGTITAKHSASSYIACVFQYDPLAGRTIKRDREILSLGDLANYAWYTHRDGLVWHQNLFTQSMKTRRVP